MICRFRRRLFDFVICHHVLEHLEDPGSGGAGVSTCRRGGLDTRTEQDFGEADRFRLSPLAYFPQRGWVAL